MSTAVYKAGRMLVGGSFIVCALVSFGSEDPNEYFHEEKKHFQFAWTADTSGDRPVVNCRLFVAAVLIGY